MADYLSFLLEQAAAIEAEAYAVKYPDIQFYDLVPVDTNAPEYASHVFHFVTDRTGRAKPMGSRANDMPLADISQDKIVVTIEDYWLGYDFSDTELGQAQLVGVPLESRKVMAVRRGFDETLDQLVLYGSTDHQWDGLINNPNATRVDADQGENGADAAAKRLWINKTAEEILLDVNRALEGVYVDTTTVELADTLALPPNIWAELSSKFIRGTAQTVGRHIMENNTYTMHTGNPLMIREIRGLENAAASNLGRMMVYKMDPDVLKLHLPMPMQFFEPVRTILGYIVPAMMRTAGLEVRRPKAIRYVDGITS